MNRYRTKKEVLEALGKNGKDVRYLDRALANGRVIMMWWGYYLQKEYIEWCWEREEESKKEIESLKNKIDELEYELENTQSSGDRKMAEKIYAFLVYQCHMDIDKTEFMEAIGF